MIKLAPPPRIASALDKSTASGFSIVWEKWFQQIAVALNIPQFANEQLQPAADGSNKQFRLSNAPDPTSGLIMFDGTTGVLIAPTSYFVNGKIVTFYAGPAAGAAPYASYRY